MDSADPQTEAPGGAEETGRDEMRDGEMSLMEHLADLRIRIIYSAAWFLVGCIIAWNFRETLFLFMKAPLELGADSADAATIHHKDLAEPFFVFLKITGVAGTFLALPGILYNVWKFIAPGLYKDEKRLAIPFVIMATGFFVGGAAFCYYMVLPFGYNVLLEFAAGVSSPQLMMQEYFQITSKLLLGFGLIFELPVFSMFFSALGVITHRTLLQYWRFAMVGAFLMAAIFTPPDILTQLMMAGPLVILYGLSIAIAWFFTRRNARDTG
jgi:sec-independent protein translocase protein TatC